MSHKSLGEDQIQDILNSVVDDLGDNGEEEIVCDKDLEEEKLLSDESGFSFLSFKEDSDNYGDDQYITSRDGQSVRKLLLPPNEELCV